MRVCVGGGGGWGGGGGRVKVLCRSQGCHWTFAKITENLLVRAVSQKMNTKRDKVQKEKDEIGERIGPKITEKPRKITENQHPCVQTFSLTLDLRSNN